MAVAPCQDPVLILVKADNPCISAPEAGIAEVPANYRTIFNGGAGTSRRPEPTPFTIAADPITRSLIRVGHCLDNEDVVDPAISSFDIDVHPAPGPARAATKSCAVEPRDSRPTCQANTP